MKIKLKKKRTLLKLMSHASMIIS